MKLTQGAFSFLPDLTDEQISKQIQYAIDKAWAISIEYTDDPHLPYASTYRLHGSSCRGSSDESKLSYLHGEGEVAYRSYETSKPLFEQLCNQLQGQS